MNNAVNSIVITTILNQRRVLSQLKEGRLSKTDFEILAYSFKSQLFCLNQVRHAFPYINPQYIRKSVARLIDNNYLQLMKKGHGKKPSYYLISHVGGQRLEQIIYEMIY